MIRLIRSKGIGVYLVTQTRKDVPRDVLAQLGLRVQHALRAHTPDDDHRREVVRGLFGLLGAKPPRSTTRRRTRR